MPEIILHLAFRADWDAGVASGAYQAPSLAEEGFIHASADEAQLLRVAARLFVGRTDLLALDVDTDQLPAESPVIREAARSGEIYPHVYGPINPGAPSIRVRWCGCAGWYPMTASRAGLRWWKWLEGNGGRI